MEDMSSPRESETRLPEWRRAQSAGVAQSPCGPDSYAHLSLRPLVDCIANGDVSAQLQMRGHRTKGNHGREATHRNQGNSPQRRLVVGETRPLRSLTLVVSAIAILRK